MAHLLSYLRWLTDDFGVWQHTKGDEIHWEMGYALDDAARGLIVFLEFGDLKRANVCLDYLEKSQTPKGFVGFFDENRKPLDNQSSHDAHALAVWALAESIKHGFETKKAKAILAKVDVSEHLEKGYLRTLSYLLLAYCALGDKQQAKKVANKLWQHYIPELHWFEERLTYANGAIPWALIRYHRLFETSKVNEKRLKEAIDVLEDYSRIGVIPAPVGNRIWQRVGAVERDIYGQQPIDPGFMVLMLVEAYETFKEKRYHTQAGEWLDWFYGNNIYKANLISDQNACADGLYALPRGVCDNKGAESTIMYLLAYNAYHKNGKGTPKNENSTPRH